MKKMVKNFLSILLLLVVQFDITANTSNEINNAVISGELKKWHTVTLTFDGPDVSESDEYNPFFNYRLDVTFLHKATGKKYRVPGYFAADGNAGMTSATAGNKWRVHFTPDEIGDWNYNVEFMLNS